MKCYELRRSQQCTFGKTIKYQVSVGQCLRVVDSLVQKGSVAMAPPPSSGNWKVG
jgi:polypeptide N-acetylgalactosaminyltransferase